jgi:hypothetical protein
LRLRAGEREGAAALNCATPDIGHLLNQQHAGAEFSRFQRSCVAGKAAAYDEQVDLSGVSKIHLGRPSYSHVDE